MEMDKLAQDILNVGHNDDCILCGFKDKLAKQALDEWTEDDKAFVRLCAWALGKHDSLLASAAREALDSMHEGNVYELTTQDLFVRVERRQQEAG